MDKCLCESVAESGSLEKRTLWTLLLINGFMFLAEATAGLFSDSAGLLADSLDMFADACVYGTALYAVGRSGQIRLRAAFVSGLVQIALGIGIIVEVIRRFIFGSDPVSTLMILVGIAAFIANLSCLLLLAKHREGGIHMRASWIFSANDVIANIGVVASGALVMIVGN